MDIHKRDRVFAGPMQNIKPFEFDSAVAEVFDDMAQRSIPFYKEIHSIICDLLTYHFKEGDTILDLGCSTGAAIELMSKHLWGKKAHFIGVDSSYPMIEQAQKKLSYLWHPYQLVCRDFDDYAFPTSGVVVMNYVMQFIAKEKRSQLMGKIVDSLRDGGLFIYTEKIDSADKHTHHLLTDLYYDFKRRQGYSELEIAQKREALERVLVPYTYEEQIELLRESGLSHVEMIFRWYNFACFIGIKKNANLS